MRRIERRRKLFSIFTAIMLVLSVTWGSFVYADSEELSGESQQQEEQQQEEVVEQEQPVNQMVKSNMAKISEVDEEEDPNPGTGMGIMPFNPGVAMNEKPIVGDCDPSPNMFESLVSGSNVEYWGNIKITVTVYDTDYGPKMNFSAVDKDTAESVLLSAVYVKGGSDGGYLYDYRPTGASSDTGLHAPINPSGKYAGISHLVFYFCEPEVEDEYRDIKITKVWKDAQENIFEDTTIFEEVTVKIDFTDENVQDIELALNQANNWTNQVTGIDADLEYKIVEETITNLPEGYKLIETIITGGCEEVEDADSQFKCEYVVNNIVGLEKEYEFEGTISGLKFNDLNKNGVHDENENLLSGVTIMLYNVNPVENTEAAAIATAVTDEFGLFSFKVTEEGIYYLREVAPVGWIQSAPANNIFAITLTEIKNNFPEDFESDEAYQGIIKQYVKGEVQTLGAFIFGNYQMEENLENVIEGYKFNDINANGVWDEGELGLQGWIITLWKYLGDVDENGVLSAADLQSVGTAVTEVNGYYKFIGMEANATYYLSENIAQNTGWAQTYPVQGDVIVGLGTLNKVENMIAGQTISNVNFGNYQPTTPGGGGGGGGGQTEETPVEETLIQEVLGNDQTPADPVEEELMTLSIPVFSGPEEEMTFELPVFSSDELNPQTADAGIAMQLQMLGVSLAGMYILRRKMR